MIRRVLSWLYSWFVASDSSIYKESDQGIFRFHDGKKLVCADPLVLYRRLMDVGPGLDADLKGSRSELKIAPIAYRDAVNTIRGIFNITQPVNDFDCTETLTETQCMALLDNFMKYCNRVKKNSPQTSISAAVPLPNGDQLPDAAHPTLSPSDSGSIAEEAKTNSPTPSPSEPALPVE